VSHKENFQKMRVAAGHLAGDLRIRSIAILRLAGQPQFSPYVPFRRSLPSRESLRDIEAVASPARGCKQKLNH